MNILMVGPWDHEIGGVDYVTGNLASYLQEKRHKVYFMHPGQQNLLEKRITKWGFAGYSLRLRGPIIEDCVIRSFIAFLFFFPLTLIQIFYVILTHKIKIINLHFPSTDMFYFAICRRLLGIRLVTSIHGADVFPEGRPRDRFSVGMEFLLASSDCIVAPSKAYLFDFINLFPKHKQKGYYIHNGVNITELSSNIKTQKDRYESKYLLCIAAHKEKKGIDVLIRAFSQIAEYDTSIQLFLIGDGPLRQQNEELTQSLGIQNRVKFFGERGRSEVIPLLQGCEILILPSRSEPFGIVIAEAMACKKPVVATKVGGIPEIIEDGKSGVLVEPDNQDALSSAICHILNDLDFKVFLAKNGRDRILANFSFEHNGSKYEMLFSKLTKET